MNKTIALVLTMAFTQWGYAADSHTKKDNLDAHVHGVSELTIAIEGKALQIEFESPAMNLVGFEHKAKSSQDKEIVKKVVAALKKADALFSFSNAGCKQVEASVDASGLLSSHDDHDEHDDHGSRDDHDDKHAGKDDHHDHDKGHHEDEKHGHEKHDHEKDHHDHSKHDSESHSEIVASYFFECKDRNSLSSISVELFKAFPGIHKINTMWVSESNQGAVNLSAKNKVINLR